MFSTRAGIPAQKSPLSRVLFLCRDAAPQLSGCGAAAACAPDFPDLPLKRA